MRKNPSPKMVKALLIELAKGPTTVRAVAEASGSSPRSGDWHRALTYIKQTQTVCRAGRLYWLPNAPGASVPQISEGTIEAACRHLESTAEARLAALLAEQAKQRERLSCRKGIHKRQVEGYNRRFYRTAYNSGGPMGAPVPVEGIVFGKKFEATLPRMEKAS